MEENILLVLMDSCVDEIEVGANCMVKIAVREHCKSDLTPGRHGGFSNEGRGDKAIKSN